MKESLRVVLASPLYRGATIAIFLSALGVAAAAPQVTSFLVTQLHASYAVAGLYSLTSLAAPLAGYLVGSRSDKSGRRLGLFRCCAVLGFVGWTALAFATQVWMPFVTSTVLLGFGGASAAQLFAAVHDEIAARRAAGGGDDHADEGVTSVVRMAMTAGWVIGPAAGSLIAAGAGARALLLATGVCSLLQIVPLGTQGGSRRAVPHRPTPAIKPTLREMVPLFAYVVCYLGVNAGESVKFAYLPIYMRTDLHLAPGVSGAILGFQPFVELVLIPVAVRASRRIGSFRLLAMAAVCSCTAHLCFATTGSVAGILVGQVLLGCVWAVFAGLGIIVAQRMLPTAVATASGIFMSTGPISGAVGGLGGGLGAASLGLPHVFYVPAAMAFLAVVGFTTMSLRPVRTPEFVAAA